MGKLEYLQKLNPYLPYDLVVMSGDSYDTDDRLEHKGVMTYGHSSDDNSRSKDFSITEIAFSENNIVTRLGVIKRRVKPVLKPLSDLYKEIDGEVGIVEIFRMFGIYHENICVTNCGLKYNDGAEWLLFDWSYSAQSFIDSDGGIYLNMESITYLFQHHYDVYDLHSKGLCIYENEIK